MATSAASAQAHSPAVRPVGDARVQLAREPDFAVGPLQFVPSRRVIQPRDGGEHVVEPRVMQVLVALFRAGGGIVGRDDLITACWEGRIVGDDAINRVISRVRRIQETIGAGVFEVETVTRVGYRIRTLAAVEHPSTPGLDIRAQEAPHHAQTGLTAVSRRTIVRAAAALTTAAGVPALLSVGDRTRWFGLLGHRPNAEARRFYDEGMRVQYYGLTATSEGAEAYFRQAAERDPDWPDAWGSLAMSYRHLLDGESNAAQWRLAELTRSAAERALALDRDNAEALVALTLMRSPYRRWAQTEREYRALLQRYPAAFVLRGHLGRLLRDVGRYATALEMTGRIVREQPFVIYPLAFHAQTLWGLGRLHEAEIAYRTLIERWPRHLYAWQAYVHFLLYSGQPGAAAVFVSDRDARPADVTDAVLDRRMQEARALASGNGVEIEQARKAVAAIDLRSPAEPAASEWLLPFYVATGDLDTVFARLDGFFFDRGRFGSPSTVFGPLTRRESAFLFMPWAQALRRDRRFAPLTARIGLSGYWRDTGTRPDIPAA